MGIKMKKMIVILTILTGCAPNYVELYDKYDNFTRVYKSKVEIKGKFLFLTEDARTPREIAVMLQNENPFGFISVNKYRDLAQFHRRLYNAIQLIFPYAEFDTLTINDQNLLEEGKIDFPELINQYKADGIFMGKLYNLIISADGNFRGTYRFQLKEFKDNKTLISGIIERKQKFNLTNPVPFYIPFLSNWAMAKIYRSGYKEAEKWFIDEITKDIKDKAEISKKYYDFDRGFTGKRNKDLTNYKNLSTIIGIEYLLGASAYALIPFSPRGEYTKDILLLTTGLFPITIISQDYIDGNASGTMLGIGCLGSILAGNYIYNGLATSGDFMKPLLIGMGSMAGTYYGTKMRFQKKRDYKGGLKER